MADTNHFKITMMSGGMDFFNVATVDEAIAAFRAKHNYLGGLQVKNRRSVWHATNVDKGGKRVEIISGPAHLRKA